MGTQSGGDVSGIIAAIKQGAEVNREILRDNLADRQRECEQTIGNLAAIRNVGPVGDELLRAILGNPTS